VACLQVQIFVHAFEFIGAEDTYTCGEPRDVHFCSEVQQAVHRLPHFWNYQVDCRMNVSRIGMLSVMWLTIKLRMQFKLCDDSDCNISAAQDEDLERLPDKGISYASAAYRRRVQRIRRLTCYSYRELVSCLPLSHLQRIAP
jgi:hypothetical protein